MHPGDFVVLDQLVDRTWGRPDTYYDAGLAHHVSFADPYCPVVAASAVAAGRRTGVTMHERGTVVVVQGPRFSTRAESQWFASGPSTPSFKHVKAARWSGMQPPLTQTCPDGQAGAASLVANGVYSPEFVQDLADKSRFCTAWGLVTRARRLAGRLRPRRAC